MKDLNEVVICYECDVDNFKGVASGVVASKNQPISVSDWDLLDSHERELFTPLTFKKSLERVKDSSAMLSKHIEDNFKYKNKEESLNNVRATLSDLKKLMAFVDTGFHFIDKEKAVK